MQIENTRAGFWFRVFGYAFGFKAYCLGSRGKGKFIFFERGIGGLR